MTVQLAQNQKTTGELLAVEPDALLLVTAEGTLVRAPLRRVQLLRTEVGYFMIPLIESSRTRLGHVARYPQGVSPELERQLLLAYGQDRVKVLGEPEATPQALLERVRAATERYRDQALTVPDGFRPVGPDAPSMGIHWINVQRVLSGRLDPVALSVLEYITVRGKAALAGVAYVAPDAPPPAGMPVATEAWHFHTGTVDEESFLRGRALALLAAAARWREAWREATRASWSRTSGASRASSPGRPWARV